MQTRNHFSPYPRKKSLAFKSRVAAPARTHLGSIGQRGMACTRVLAASRADQQHVRHMHRPFLLQNSTLDVLRRVRTRVLLHHVRVLDRHRQFPGIHRKHSPGLPLRSPGHDLHHVSVADAECCRLFLYFSHGYHTSGASEMILVNFLSRNSRATGPKTRVPIGSFASLINTAALSSKRMYVPSLRRCSFRVRTITHFTTDRSEEHTSELQSRS